jgi:hypothetical protein
MKHVNPAIGAVSVFLKRGEGVAPIPISEAENEWHRELSYNTRLTKKWSANAGPGTAAPHDY